MTTTINREIAAKINPLVDSLWTEETLTNSVQALAYMEEMSLKTTDGSIDVSIPATTGYYFIMESIRAALKYEIDILGEERQANAAQKKTHR